MTNQPILVIEDSPEDFETTVRGLKKAGVARQILRCEDGDEALSFLRGCAGDEEDGGNRRPGMILLDLNLPGTDGREVLAEIKKDPALRAIPVIVLTTSQDERDVRTCYEAGANSYIHKPVHIGTFMKAIQGLKNYWFDIVVLPNKIE